MIRQLDIVIERIARAMCATQNSCKPNDAYCDAYWKNFAPAALAAYREIVALDEDRANNTQQQSKAKKKFEMLYFPILEL